MTSSVDSRISPKRYESLLSEIEKEDQNIRSDLYELSIYEHTIMISPGKTIEDDEIKDLVYCYIYAVKNDKVINKLGVYEKFTKEKEEFFDLTTFGKGTMCLFEKYETNPSLFLEFKTDEEKKETKKPKSKSKKVKSEVDENEVDLNAPEPTVVTEDQKEVDPPEVDPNEVDLNAPEPEPKSKTPVPPVDPNEIDLNAPEAETPKASTKKTETPKSEPPLIDVKKMESELGIEPESPKKTKSSKIKLKAKTPETQEPKAETKPKTRTKKAKPIEPGEAPGTKFG